MVTSLLKLRSGGRKTNFRDWIVYGYLILGLMLMLGPVLWAAASSLKTPESIAKYPPEALPRSPVSVVVEGFDDPLPLFDVTLEDGTVVELAQVRRIGLEAQLVDPETPSELIKVPVDSIEGSRELHLAFNNYVEPLQEFNFVTYFKNSAFVTVAATLVTLLIASMAGFALSKYKFRGRGLVLGLVVSQLLVPGTVLLVPTFLIISWLGWFNSFNALIWPVVATPVGVFLLRQYMLTIPDEMLDAARIDGATEWRVYWETVVPLAAPAISVLTIFSIMWRWNDFIWPLIVISDTNLYTLPLALSRFDSEFTTAWEQLLAMTVLSLLPITVMFAFLQKFITTGIASVGVKG